MNQIPEHNSASPSLDKTARAEAPYLRPGMEAPWAASRSFVLRIGVRMVLAHYSSIQVSYRSRRLPDLQRFGACW